MAEEKDDAVVRVEGLLAEREALAAKEKKLVEELNALLGKIGYRVVPLSTKGTAAAGPGRKPGRPPGGGKAPAPKG